MPAHARRRPAPISPTRRIRVATRMARPPGPSAPHPSGAHIPAGTSTRRLSESRRRPSGPCPRLHSGPVRRKPKPSPLEHKPQPLVGSGRPTGVFGLVVTLRVSPSLSAADGRPTGARGLRLRHDSLRVSPSRSAARAQSAHCCSRGRAWSALPLELEHEPPPPARTDRSGRGPDACRAGRPEPASRLPMVEWVGPPTRARTCGPESGLSPGGGLGSQWSCPSMERLYCGFIACYCNCCSCCCRTGATRRKQTQ